MATSVFARQWLFLGAALMLLGGAIAIDLFKDHQRINIQERERLAALADTLAKNIAPQVVLADRIITNILNALPSWQAENDGFQRANREIKIINDTISGIPPLLVINASGEVVISSNKNLIGSDFSYREYFKTAAATSDQRVIQASAPFKTILNDFAFTLSRSIIGADGKFAGVVVVTEVPAYFSNLLDSVRYSPDVRTWIVHGDGALFFSAPRVGIEGEDLAKPGSFFTRHRESGQLASVFTGTAYATGDERIAAQRTLQLIDRPAMDKPLVIGVSRNLGSMYAPWRREVGFRTIIFLAILSISTFCLFLYQKTKKTYELLTNAQEEQRKQVERDLRESEQRYRSLFDNAEVAMFRTRLDGSEVLDCNEKFLAMLGYSRDEVIGSPSRILWKDPEERQRMVARLGAEGHLGDLEYRMMNRDGETLWCVTSLRLLREQGILEGSIQDITERKLGEKELLDMNEALRRSNADLEQFAYVSSHDLQTPLRNIVSYSQLLERRYKGKIDADADDFIGFIVDSAKQMTRLINDLLEFSRVSRQSQPPHPTSAGAAVAQALKTLGTDLDKVGASVSVGDLPVVLADHTHLVSLFQNLLGNAIKYRAADRKPALSVTAEPDSDWWRFAVTDNGIGIEPAYHDKIFEIFQRLNPASGAEGTGIGLTLCRRIVHRFGGAIWVDSVPGVGATFFFTLRDGSTAT